MSDVRFLASVLRDAEALTWAEGQLERRKRAVQTIMTGRKEEEFTVEDELFQKKGWNRVDSGFSLWGRTSAEPKPKSGDDFLQSKGWNDVDSGFRII